MPYPVCFARTMSYCSDWCHLIVFLVRPSLVTLSSLLLLSPSLSPCRSHPVFIFCLAILLAFCLLFSALRQLLSDIEKLGCGCHTRAPKPISVSCVCRGAEAEYFSIKVQNTSKRNRASSHRCVNDVTKIRRHRGTNVITLSREGTGK